MGEKTVRLGQAEVMVPPTEVLVVHRPTKIICCDAGAWVKAYAYFVIVSLKNIWAWKLLIFTNFSQVTSLVGLMITIPALFTYYYPPNIPEEFIQSMQIFPKILVNFF